MRHDFLDDLLGQVGASVIHGHDDPFDVDGRIGAAVAQFVDHAAHHGESLQGEIFALDGEDHSAGCRKHIHRQHAEGG